jgi:hypothetical protein
MALGVNKSPSRPDGFDSGTFGSGQSRHERRTMT